MKLKEIRISDCVHFRGFRYGGFGNNIYEDYVCGLANGLDTNSLKKQFIRRVLAYNGLDFSSALNIRLTRKYPTWAFPWTFHSALKRDFSQWGPEDNPDIICHHSPRGLLASHINREFAWFGRAYGAVLAGYNPAVFGYPRVIGMRCNGLVRYLVLDGNHRISSLHAIGCESVLAQVFTPILWSIGAAPLWPGVISGNFTLADAKAIFNRYFFEDNILLSETELQEIILDEPLLLDGEATAGPDV